MELIKKKQQIKQSRQRKNERNENTRTFHSDAANNTGNKEK